MIHRRSIGFIALTLAICLTVAGAQAFDETKYPEWKGQWGRLQTLRDKASPNPSFDPNKFQGLAQEAPLTPEYQAILEASLKDQANGGQGNWMSGARCLPPGMPATMNGYNSMEIVMLPEVTYVLVEHDLPIHRRIFTDGRDWPAQIKPTFDGYSIGKWVEPDGGGRYGALMVETRGMRGPRTLDADGLPLHKDNRTVVKERIALDRANRDLLHDEITTIDNAFTRPWTVTRDYQREPHPVWPEFLCAEANNHIPIGEEFYFRSADGDLMPAYKNQPPPDLRNFSGTR